MPDNSFPGYDDAIRMLSSSSVYLTTQGTLWNRAWAEMMAGNFKFESWIATAAKSLDNHWEFARGLIREPRPVNEAPPWVRLDWAVGDPVPPGRPSPPLAGTFTAELVPTDFCRLGPGAAPLVPIRPFVAPGGATNNLDVQLSSKAIQPQDPGLYISFVFEKGKGSAPVLIILLQVGSDGVTTAPSAATTRGV